MLRDFFRINMPYVIEKVDKLDGQWVVMNRAYSPLGYHNSDRLKWELFPKEYVRFAKINKSVLEKLEKAGAIIRRDETGQATRITLYNDGSVPVDRYDIKLDKAKWDKYCKLLEILATITTN